MFANLIILLLQSKSVTKFVKSVSLLLRTCRSKRLLQFVVLLSVKLWGIGKKSVRQALYS